MCHSFKRLARRSDYTNNMRIRLSILVGILKDRLAGWGAYARAMRSALSRKPFLKTDGRYLSRDDAHRRACLPK